MRSGNLLATIMVFGTGIALAVGIAALLQPPVAEAKSYGSREAVVELGRRLFMDHTVSRAGQFSCASCHEPEHGFSDPRKVSEDENGKTLRHSQTLIDLKDGTGFHWDGEFDYLHELLVARLAPVPEVMAQTRALVQRHFQVSQTRGDRPSEEQYQKKLRELTPPYYGPDVPSSGTPRPLPQPLVRRLESDGRYDEAFRAAYGSKEPTTERIVESMKAYMLSIQSTPNRHDQYLAGKPEALTASERRGLRLFEGKAACAKCHDSRSINGEKPTFTDYAFRNTGVSFQRAKVSYEKGWELDAGLGAQTFASVDIGRFKVPTLRDVAVRAPYMHDGEFETLEEVVDYYVKGGTNNGGLDRKIHAFELTKKERADLVAFLKSLTGTERAGLGKPTKYRAKEMRVKLVGVDGKPMKNLTFKVSPYGDRLEGASRKVEPFAVTTGATGYAKFEMPLYTHVLLTAPGYEIGYDRPIPDTVTRPIKLLAAPRKKIHMEVFRSPRGKNVPTTITGTTRVGNQSITFKRVRTLGGGRYLYVAKKPQKTEEMEVFFRDAQGPRGAQLRRIDTTGGMTEPLDLRE